MTGGWNRSSDLDARLKDMEGLGFGYQDPSAVATPGRTGTLFVQLGSNVVWQKQDDGNTTNWTPVIGGGPLAAQGYVLYASSFNPNAGDGSEANPFQSLQAAVDAANAAAIALPGHRLYYRFTIDIMPGSEFDEDVVIPAGFNCELYCRAGWGLGTQNPLSVRTLTIQTDQAVVDADGPPPAQPSIDITSDVPAAPGPQIDYAAVITGGMIIGDGTEVDPNTVTFFKWRNLVILGNIDATLNTGASQYFIDRTMINFGGGDFLAPSAILQGAENTVLLGENYAFDQYQFLSGCTFAPGGGGGLMNFTVTTNPPFVGFSKFIDCFFLPGFTFTGPASFYADEVSQQAFVNAGGILAGGAVYVRLDVDENETASSQGGFASLVMPKVGLDLQFRSLQSSDASITITENADNIDLVAAGGGAPTGDANTLAFFNAATNLASNTDAQYLDALITIALGTLNVPQGLTSLLIGNAIADDATSLYNIMVGDTLSVTFAGYGVYCGNNVTINDSVSSFIGGSSNSMTQTYNCVVVGNLNSLPAITTNSIVGGVSNTLNTINRSVIVGSTNSHNTVNDCLAGGLGNTIQTTNRSIIAGANNFFATTSDSIMAGENHNFAGTTIQNTLIVGDNRDRAGGTLADSIICGNGNLSGTGTIASSVLSSGALTIGSTLARTVVCGTAHSLDLTTNCIINGNGNTLTSNAQSYIGGSFNTFSVCNDGVYVGNGNDVSGSRSFVGGSSNQIVSMSDSFVIGVGHIALTALSSVVCGDGGDFTSGSANSSFVSANGSTFGTINSSFVSTVSANTASTTITQSILIGNGRTLTGGSLLRSIAFGSGTITNGANNVIDSIIGGTTHTVTGPLNRSIVMGQNHSVQEDDNAVFGRQHTVQGSNNIFGGDTNSGTGFSNSILVGNNLTHARNNQAIFGFYNLANATAIFQIGIGTGIGTEANAFEIDENGVTRRELAGLRVRVREAVDPNIDANTDYFVRALPTSASASLPAGVDGMEYVIKNAAAGNVTVSPSGGDTIDGAGSLVLASGESAHLFFLNGDWSAVQ